MAIFDPESVTLAPNLTDILVKFNREIRLAEAPDGSGGVIPTDDVEGFGVKVNASEVAIASAKLATPDTIKISLESPVDKALAGKLTHSYDPKEGNVRDTTGNELAQLSGAKVDYKP